MSPDDEEHITRKILRKHSEIEKLKSEFGLSEDAKDAAILLYRILVGLGKGLASSQEKGYSAIAVWFASKLVDGRKLPKIQLAEAMDVSHRTLTRRFKEVSKDGECEKMLDYLKERIKKWSRRKERKLREYL
ncbi:hypothetical protein AKJ41_05200 [candidate division MSBL1 archaeon SCGC-AAA259O05]|uniref:Transcription factor TFIIB cyclin-like domain-containing protein n=1 Tax=candidate division MSBL1 archaeon SCGC-AAA259O05 TaxID=1698271 RepID=A0A133UZH5_9EURY|nr:hypothetical protein AKJ41_05200 [candidate division MSBL1 archaeon SCGC-AAA259O05]